MKEFLETLIKQLVDKPEEVQITALPGESVVVFELKLGAGDVGKVIGKRGQNVMAIRTLLNAVAAKDKKRAIIEIIE